MNDLKMNGRWQDIRNEVKNVWGNLVGPSTDDIRNLVTRESLGSHESEVNS